MSWEHHQMEGKKNNQFATSPLAATRAASIGLSIVKYVSLDMVTGGWS